MTTLIDDHDLSVPSLYAPVAITREQDATETARGLAESGSDPGAFVWARRDDRVDCAVVLAPEAPYAESLLVSYVATVGIGDALGALIPPVTPVTFGWPDRILINGATAGGIRVLAAPTQSVDAVPEWMVVGLQLGIKIDLSTEPGAAPDRTTLAEEGCGDVGVVDLLESFSRHFLYWINRWQEDGFAPVKTAWLGRAVGYGPNTQMETLGDWARRKLLVLYDDGSVQFAEDGEDGKDVTVPLADALRNPSWSL